MKKTTRVSYEEFVKEYKKYKWIKVGEWEGIANVSNSIFASSSTREGYEYYGIPCEPVFYVHVMGQAYIPEERAEKLHKFFLDKIEANDFDLFYEIISKLKEIYGEIEVLKNKVLDSSVKDEDFYDKFKELIDKLILMTSTFEFERVLSEVLDEKLAAKLKELGREDVYLPQLIDEDDYTDVGKLNLTIKDLAKKVESGDLKKGSEEFKKEIEKLVLEYAYMGTYLLTGEPYVYSDIEGMFEKTLAGLGEVKEEEKPVFEDEFVLKLIELVNMFSRNKFRRIEILNETLYDLQPVYKAISEEGNVEYDKIIQLCVDEMLSYVNSGYKDLNSENDFKVMHYMNSKEDVVYVLSEEDAVRLKKEYFDKDLGDLNELKGSTAFVGKAQGVVKVISGHKDFHKFEEGDVLVCSMTDPNYVPLMKKSSAVVTDMGGVLSHAAIVAREMKKPCVINTKIATKVLKDGDRIEVDADNGIVKILEKEK